MGSYNVIVSHSHPVVRHASYWEVSFCFNVSEVQRRSQCNDHCDCHQQ